MNVLIILSMFVMKYNLDEGQTAMEYFRFKQSSGNVEIAIDFCSREKIVIFCDRGLTFSAIHFPVNLVRGRLHND